MKKSLFLWGYIASFSFFLACDNDETFIEKELSFAANVNEIKLSDDKSNDEALALHWNKVSTSVAYALQYDLRNNNFANSVKRNFGGKTSYSFSHSELNEMLLSQWTNLSYDEPTALDFRLLVLDGNTSETLDSSQVITINITPYKAQYLYLIGDATPNGWNADNATVMNPVFLKNNVFSWKGYLKNGEFKFITSLRNFIPAYVRDENNAEKMIYRPDEGAYPDFKWEIKETGFYEITANLNDLTISVLPYLDNIWLIGTAANGWSWNNIVPMQSTDGHIYTYCGHLNAGELKFPIEKITDFTGLFILATEANRAPQADDTFVVANTPDNKWKISQAGDYNITIDYPNKKISIVKQ